ncbi:hypothetical protein [Kitasatospora fiedleri]|uniref:hypothetical protein n=1 Tax=Kitasatospora fiedleri TaxID=2991545 RepID=UPI00249BFA8C|nr:hypothetical protein [Kitasatospora fiedleri]
MSQQDLVFVADDRPLAEAAREIARAVGASVDPEHSSPERISLVLNSSSAGAEVEVRCHVERNVFAEKDPSPEEVNAYDGYPVLLDVWLRRRDDRRQQAEAKALFERLAQASPQAPTLLVQELGLLVAAHLPARGVHEFPPDTTVDAEDRDAWGDWVVPGT